MDGTIKIVLLCLILILEAQSQHITGKLVNEESIPINFALVSFYQLGAEYPTTQQFPNEQGQFSFSSSESGSYFVLVEGGMGFQPHQSDTLILTGDSTQVIDLGTITVQYQIQERQTIVVEADAITPMLEHDVDKTTMNIEGSSLSTLPNLSMALRLVPEVANDGGNLTVNGKGKILVLINGKRTTMSLENISPSMVKSVDVVSNPSAEYDADVEAIINVTLKKGSLEGIHGNFYANYIQGIHPRASLGANLDINKKKFSAHFDINYEYNRLRTTSDVNRIFEETIPFYYSETNLTQELMDHNLSTNLNLSWRFNEQHRIEIMGGGSFNRAPNNTTQQEDIFTSTPEGTTIDSSLSNTTNTQSIADNFQARLSYDGHFGENWALSTTIDYMRLNPYKYSKYNFGFSDVFNANRNFVFDYTMNDSTRAHLWIGRVDLTWNEKGHEIKGGVQYTAINTFYNISFDNNDVQLTGEDNWFKYNEQIYAVYGQWRGGLQNWKWRLGLRGEYSKTQGIDRQDTESDWEQLDYFPSAGVLFMPVENHIFRLTYSKSIQRVGFLGRSPYQFFTGLYTSFEGNPNLRPQITHSTDLTYILMRRYVFNAYYNEVIDYISQISELRGTLQTFRPINFRSTNYGLSFTTQFYLSDWWQLSFKAEGKGIRTHGVNQGETFDNHSIYTNLALVQDFNCWNWMNLGVTVSYTSPYTVGIYNTGHLFFVDVNLHKTFANDQWTVALYISDVFGTHLNRNSVNFNAQQMTAIHNNDVRTATLSLIYNFSRGRGQEDTGESNVDEQTLNRILENR